MEKGIEQAVVGEALLAFTHPLIGNKAPVPGVHTNLLLNVDIEVLAAVAVEAKRRIEAERILTLREDLATSVNTRGARIHSRPRLRTSNPF